MGVMVSSMTWNSQGIFIGFLLLGVQRIGEQHAKMIHFMWCLISFSDYFNIVLYYRFINSN